MIGLWVALGVVLVLALIGFLLYNGLVTLRNSVEEAWSQIDVQLKRRADLLPNLVDTVKGYAKHEQETFAQITEARKIIGNSNLSPEDAAKGSAMMDQGLGRLLAVVESYPDLKASQNFMNLQEELATTENKIAFSRQHYNSSVAKLNTKVEVVPTNIIANMAGIRRHEYFNIPEGADDRNVPDVSF